MFIIFSPFYLHVIHLSPSLHSARLITSAAHACHSYRSHSGGCLHNMASCRQKRACGLFSQHQNFTLSFSTLKPSELRLAFRVVQNDSLFASLCHQERGNARSCVSSCLPVTVFFRRPSEALDRRLCPRPFSVFLVPQSCHALR